MRGNHLPFPGALRSDLHNKMLCQKETERKGERASKAGLEPGRHIRCAQKQARHSVCVGWGVGGGVTAASVGMNLWHNI